MRSLSKPLVHATLALAAALALAGCDRAKDDETVGQQPGMTAPSDSAPTRIGEAIDRAGERAGQAIDRAGAEAGEAMEAAADKVKDAAITTAIKAKLAADDKLRALQIDVDTRNGRVSLRGTAPDAQARTRATVVAMGVDGVVSVDNQLQLAG